jgi:hypothetical protein
MAPARFHQLLEQALEERSEAEAIVNHRATGNHRRPGAAATRRPVPAPPAQSGQARRSGSSLGFWRRLERAQRELGGADTRLVAVTGVVGPLAACIPVVRHGLSRRRGGDCEVAVLTSRAELVSEPTWRLVRDGSRLVEIATARRRPFALLVIDVRGPELPLWVGPLLERLRDAGVGLVRHVVAGDPSDDELASGRQVLGEPLVVDLLHAVQPARVLELTGRGAPIASVGGVPLSAELLMAMRAEVADG